ncbi:MAG TPA: ABC transporter substrate-binding protein, partial [Ilumatobacter sp.]|nr:ABC transporter substrate-binding protein [Ilumatobacter sp.]
LIVATGHPPGSGPITVQSLDLGIDVPITGAYSPFALVFNGAGEAAIDRYSDFDCADWESEEYHDLARRFLAMSDQTFMEDDAVAGYGIVTMLADAAAAVDGIDLQVEVAPVPETDFTTYLRNLEGFGPELIVATGHPPGSGPITVQSADLGLDLPITGAYSPFALVWNGAGEAAIDRYSDFDCADWESEEYHDLARRFLAMSDQTFMEDDAVAGYGIVTMLADAVAAVGDDPAAISEYLHGQSYDLPGYPHTMSWTEWGEMAEAQPLFSTMSRDVEIPEGVTEAGDWYPKVLLRPAPLEPYEPG